MLCYRCKKEISQTYPEACLYYKGKLRYLCPSCEEIRQSISVILLHTEREWRHYFVKGEDVIPVLKQNLENLKQLEPKEV